MFLNEFVLIEKLSKMTTRQWCFAIGALVVVVGLLIYLAKRPQKEGKTDVRALTYGALCMAMSFVLSYIKLYSMPLGGSVTLASMLPLLWYSNKFGMRNGFIAGAAYGLLQLIQKPEIYHWVQVLLDYPLAFMMLGLAGSVKNLQLGSILGVAGRWICHIISGAVFFGEWMPEGWSNAWVYSAAYNGAYLLVDLIICIVLSFVLAKALDKIPTGRK
jgi:thiamine transporter